MRSVILSALVSLANAIAVDSDPRDGPISVKLDVVGNTAIKASVTNTGSTALNVFRTGTILDDAAVEKVKVYQGASKIPFTGIRLYVSTQGLDESSFQSIAPGETLEKEFDISHAHDVGVGGQFDLFMDSAISYADINSTELVGAATFKSNLVTANVDGAQARATRDAFLKKTKRTAVQSDCAGSQKDALVKAIGICQTRATAAAAAAQNNSAKVKEYFKKDTASVKNTVADVFTKMAAECSNTTGGVSKTYCSDVGQSCSGGVIAYTAPASSYMVFCPSWFSQMDERSATCHHDDKPFVITHETTHLTQIKGTDDYGVYGYAAVQKLTAAQNLNHADTYALFANAIEIGAAC